MDVDLAHVPRGHQADRLAGELRASVRNGTLRAGTRLPASRTLAGDLGVSRGVVVRAYELLAAEGYLVSRQGSGTAVAAVAGGADHPPVAPVRPVSNPGLPSGGTFPRAAWARCGSRALATLTDDDLGYGDPAGLPRLREELARYLGRVRSVLAPPGRIVVVNGFAQASRLVADVLRAARTPRIGVEDPGSVGLREQLTAGGLTCVPIPVDEGGLCVDALAASGVRAVVVTPAHQFPTGVVLAPERRHALLAWARACGGLVVEDDYDAEFRYDRTPVGALQGLGPDVVLYGGSVSKTLAPGLRLGWMVVPPDRLDAYRAAKYAADLACGVLDQASLAEFLARGEMDRHIRRMTVDYRRRRDALAGAAAGHLPDWEVAGTAAGLHLVLHPPAGDDEPLAAAAQAAGLDARPLSRYCVAARQRGLVVGYGHQPPAELARAVEALGAAQAAATSTSGGAQAAAVSAARAP
jgi:GntR family transcriptional regulator/MocR family aminotransferase